MGEDAGPGTAPPVEMRDPVTGKMVLMTKSAAKKLARRERREQKKESTCHASLEGLWTRVDSPSRPSALGESGQS